MTTGTLRFDSSRMSGDLSAGFGRLSDDSIAVKPGSDEQFDDSDEDSEAEEKAIVAAAEAAKAKAAAAAAGGEVRV